MSRPTRLLGSPVSIHIVGDAGRLYPRLLAQRGGIDDTYAVLDRTGLKGRFDVELEFLQMAPTLSVDGGAAPAGQTIFDAVRDQLGLILEKRTEPIDVFVIDHVEMPMAD